MIFRKLFLLSLASFAISSRSQHCDEETHSWPQLSALIDSIDMTVLHGVLHQLAPKFQDGVFSKDRSAIEHVHSENPVIASKLVHIALKRQAANQTSVVTGETTVLVSPSAPASATAVETVDGGVVFSTIGGGLVTVSSSAAVVDFSPTTSEETFVTTLPNGDVETLTSVVVVNAPHTQTGDAGGTAGAAATTGSPGLQDAGVSLEVCGLWLALAGIAGIAFLL
jgi:hypothetical protein